MEYNYQELNKLSQKYLKGKNIQHSQKQTLRNAYRSLYKYSPIQELSEVVQSLKQVKEKAMEKGQYQVVVSSNAKISVIMRDLMKTQQTVYEQKQEDKDSPVRHLRNLFPNLKDDQQIARACSLEIARSRIK